MPTAAAPAADDSADGVDRQPAPWIAFDAAAPSHAAKQRPVLVAGCREPRVDPRDGQRPEIQHDAPAFLIGFRRADQQPAGTVRFRLHVPHIERGRGVDFAEAHPVDLAPGEGAAGRVGRGAETGVMGFGESDDVLDVGPLQALIGPSPLPSYGLTTTASPHPTTTTTCWWGSRPPNTPPQCPPRPHAGKSDC